MSQQKFGRNYNLLVQLPDDTFLNITLPFTIEFNIVRNGLASINSSQIRIYNLSANNRNLLRQDWSTYTSKRIVQLNAGYGTNLPIVLTGTIQQAYSYREGTDFVTTIECQDGAYAATNSILPPNTIFPKGTPWQIIYQTLMGYVSDTSFGFIGPSFIYEKDALGNVTNTLAKTTRSVSFTGDVISTLSKLTGRAFFIDNGKTYILTNKEVIPNQGPTPLINKYTGLLNTPLLENTIVTFDMIFEPSLFVGQLIELQSFTTPAANISVAKNVINSKFKITSLKHRATISPAVCGDAISTVEFYTVNSPLDAK